MPSEYGAQAPRKQARSSNPSARAALVQRFRDLVYTIAHEHKGDGRRDFDDLAQAGMVGLLEALDSWDPARGPLRKHVSARVRNAVMREAYGRTGSGMPTRPEYVSDEAGTVPIPVQELDAGDRAADVRHRLDAIGRADLDERERQIIVMRLQGKTQREIAGLLEVSIATVERECSAITSKLQAELAAAA